MCGAIFETRRSFFEVTLVEFKTGKEYTEIIPATNFTEANNAVSTSSLGMHSGTYQISLLDDDGRTHYPTDWFPLNMNNVHLAL